jgi:hypothetical protein
MQMCSTDKTRAHTKGRRRVASARFIYIEFYAPFILLRVGEAKCLRCVPYREKFIYPGLLLSPRHQPHRISALTFSLAESKRTRTPTLCNFVHSWTHISCFRWRCDAGRGRPNSSECDAGTGSAAHGHQRPRTPAQWIHSARRGSHQTG